MTGGSRTEGPCTPTSSNTMKRPQALHDDQATPVYWVNNVFERSCELSLWRMTGEKIRRAFGRI